MRGRDIHLESKGKVYIFTIYDSWSARSIQVCADESQTRRLEIAWAARKGRVRRLSEVD